MYCLFSDCYLLLSLPDISNWKNYNENDLNEIPNYNGIKKILNFSSDIIIFPSSGDEEILNDIEFYQKQIEDKLDKFY